QSDGAVGERAVKNVAVAGYPAKVSSTTVYSDIVIVKHILVRHGGIDHVTASGVQNALRSASRSGGVKHEQRVFRIHGLRLTLGRCVLHQVFIARVTVVVPGHLLVAGAGYHNDTINFGVALMLERGIYVLLERDGTATTKAFISGNHEPGFAVRNSCCQSFR